MNDEFIIHIFNAVLSITKFQKTKAVSEENQNHVKLFIKTQINTQRVLVKVTKSVEQIVLSRRF